MSDQYRQGELDPVQEASEESFPASDPPAWTLGEDRHYAGLIVSDNAPASRFEAHVDGKTAFLDYRRRPGEITLTHAETPPELEGRGIGSAVVRAALEFAREQKLKVVPQCPFTAWYIQQHREYLDLVSGR